MNSVTCIAAPAPSPESKAQGALPPSAYAYIKAVSARHQIPLVLLSITVFLLSVVPLEIQRRIINDAIEKDSVRAVAWLAAAYVGVALLEGLVKLGLNIYRAWVSEMVVLDLRRRVAKLPQTSLNDTKAADAAHPEGTAASMVLSEVEPIGGFAGISISEPLLQAGVLVSVFGYLIFLEPRMALWCGVAFAPQLVFVPWMQRAINRKSGKRIETLRTIAGAASAPGADKQDAANLDGRIADVFELSIGVFRVKFSMYFLMNLSHHMGVATALGVGGYYVVQGDVDVGTVVAFVSGLAKVNDPWGDLVDWFREMSLVLTRYRLFAEAMNSLGGGAAAAAAAKKPPAPDAPTGPAAGDRPKQLPVPGGGQDFSERHDDPDQAEELERQQDA
jgi:ABC-type multidrug transport system fused ATPase/permease subunit